MSTTGENSSASVHRFILLSDIAGSSRLAETQPRAYSAAIDRHNQLTEQEVTAHRGLIYKNTGDGYLALFETAATCLACATELRLKFSQAGLTVGQEPLEVRLVLHGGELRPSGQEYFGPPLNRASRICQVCSPGQLLCSGAVATALVPVPSGLQLVNLGLHHLRDLTEPEELYQVDDARLPAQEFPPLETLNNRPHNLWKHADAFIGRERELKEIAGMLGEGQRLVTIIGLGGYGKSRLSRQLLAELLPQYTNGAFFVELEPLSSAGAIASATAQALNFSFAGNADPAEQIYKFLRNKQMLICFDNFEHVLDGRAFIADILRCAPDVQLLATTREPLRIKGEQVYPLDPLPVGSSAEDADALVLFADRARKVNPDFQLTPDGAREVAAICRTLSGIPLAIELAAAWMDSFTLEELQKELEEQLELEARFDDVPGRHRSLRASLDWSWNLLGEEQRETLMRMATFRGGAFADAAGEVLGLKGMKLRKALAMLMDKSWLSTRGNAAAAGWVSKTERLGQTRWYMRDAASREYAFEKLEDSPISEPAVMAHARFFSGWVEQQGPCLSGDGTPTGQLESFELFELELQNILQAQDSLLQRSAGQDVPAREQDEMVDAPVHPAEACGFSSLLLPIVRWLWEFYQAKGKSKDQREVYSQLLANLPASADIELRFWVEFGLGNAFRRQGMVNEATRYAESCLELTDLAAESSNLNAEHVPNLRSNALNMLGTLHLIQGRIDKARSCFEAALELQRELGDRPAEAAVLNNLGLLHLNQGRMAEALESYESSLKLARELGNRWGEGFALNNLGNMHRQRGRMDEAQECIEASLAIRRELGDPRSEAHTLTTLGRLYKEQGRTADARECYESSLALYHNLGDSANEGYVLDSFAGLLLETGELAHAREMLEKYQRLSEELGVKYNLACLHPKWARYWLAVHGNTTDMPDVSDIPATPQVVLGKAIHHLNTAKGYLAEVGGTWDTEGGREIAAARREIIGFAEKHELAKQVVALAEEQASEDELRAGKPLKQE